MGPAAAIFIILKQFILAQLVLSWAISGMGYQQGTSSEYQSTLYRGALTSTSMMTNRWATGYWAVSSNDVIHNWRVAGVSDNTLRIKMDAFPGRINVSCHDRVRPNRIYLG